MSFDKAKIFNSVYQRCKLVCLLLSLAFGISIILFNMEGYFLAVEPALKKYFCKQQRHQENSQYKMWTADWV